MTTKTRAALIRRANRQKIKTLTQSEAEQNSRFNRNAKSNPPSFINEVDASKRQIETPGNPPRGLVPNDPSQLDQIQRNVQRTLAKGTAPRAPTAPRESISVNTSNFNANTLTTETSTRNDGEINPDVEANRAVRRGLQSGEYSTPGDPAQPSPVGGVEESNTAETDATLDSLISGVTFESNVLTALENPTYNWRLFMAGEHVVQENIRNSDIIVIAETGSTGFYITDVDIRSVVAPNPEIRNTFATNIKFTIIEPQGNTLFDKIRNSATELKIWDHTSIPLWLELSFKGYTGPQNNNDFDDSFIGGTPTELTNQRRLWRLVVHTVDVDINKGGSEYVFHTNPYDEIGYRDKSRRIEHDINVQATTLKDFFNGLTEELNRNNNNSTRNSIDDVLRTRGYAIELPSTQELIQAIEVATRRSTGQTTGALGTTKVTSMSEWTIRGENSAFNKRSETFDDRFSTANPSISGARPFSGGRWNIGFSGGTSVEAIIQEVIGTTAEGQSLAIYGTSGKNVKDINSAIEQRDADVPSIIFNVETTVDILSYNLAAKDYNLLITYHIRPYTTFKPILSRKHLEEASKGDTSKQRFAKQLLVSRAKKKYEYMYSGLNTEVLDFRIRFDRAWTITLPIFQGQDRNAVGSSSGSFPDAKASLQVLQSKIPPGQANSDSIKSLQSRIDDAKSNLDESRRSSSVNPPDLRLIEENVQRLSEERDALIDSNIAHEQLKRLTNVPVVNQRIETSSFGAGRLITLQNPVIGRPTSTGSNINILDSVQNQQDQFFYRGATREIGIAIQNQLTNRVPNKDGIGSATYVEDRGNISVNKKGPDISKAKNEEIIEVGMELSPTRRAYEGNAEGTVEKGRSFFSAIMNQIYGNQGQMVKIELEIRGDPYWLGETFTRERVLGTDRDITKSDVLFLMTFDFPTNINDGGGTLNQDSYSGSGLYNIEQNRQNGFNGLYFVNIVESNFSNGKFTQKLFANADPMTQEINVQRAVKADNNRKI